MCCVQDMKESYAHANSQRWKRDELSSHRCVLLSWQCFAKDGSWCDMYAVYGLFGGGGWLLMWCIQYMETFLRAHALRSMYCHPWKVSGPLESRSPRSALHLLKSFKIESHLSALRKII